jgi:hypothetical protein
MRRILFLALIFFLGTSVFAADPIAKGTKIHVRFTESLSSAQARTGDTFTAVLARELRLSAGTIIRAGATVRGHVTRSQGASIDGSTPGTLAVILDAIEDGEARYTLVSRELVRRGRAASGKNTRDPARRREAETAVSDSLESIAHPIPPNVSGADGTMQSSVESLSVEGTIPSQIELVFTTASSGKR